MSPVRLQQTFWLEYSSIIILKFWSQVLMIWACLFFSPSLPTAVRIEENICVREALQGLTKSSERP